MFVLHMDINYFYAIPRRLRNLNISFPCINTRTLILECWPFISRNRVFFFGVSGRADGIMILMNNNIKDSKWHNMQFPSNEILIWKKKCLTCALFRQCGIRIFLLFFSLVGFVCALTRGLFFSRLLLMLIVWEPILQIAVVPIFESLFGTFQRHEIRIYQYEWSPGIIFPICGGKSFIRIIFFSDIFFNLSSPTETVSLNSFYYV